MRSLIASLGLLVGVSCEPWAEFPPPPSRWASQSVPLLSEATLGALDRKLEAYQKRTHHTVMVFVTDTSHGMPHAEWTDTVFNRWSVGRKGYDDGVILFVFTDDNMRWISVGYGLEAALPDRRCAEICRTLVRPAMEAGDPDAGVTAGVAAILSDIEAWESRSYGSDTAQKYSP